MFLLGTIGLWLEIITATNAQTISLHLAVQTNDVVLQANSASNLAYRIEASENFEQWFPVTDQASGLFAHHLAPTNGLQFFRLNSWSTDDLPVTLMMVGDSTVADYVSNGGASCGWGEGMHDLFKSHVRVLNYGVPYQSSRSFLYSVEKSNMVLVKPEFVLVQFGMVDSYGIEEHTTTMPEYAANLKATLQIIRDFAGTPILVTPPAVRVFDAAGKVATPEWLKERCKVVRSVAAETQTYLVDLNESSTALFDQLGPEASAYISPNADDPRHFSFAGADIMAGFVVKALPAVVKAQALDAP
jgi:lysophospholipase L1-like esterase